MYRLHFFITKFTETFRDIAFDSLQRGLVTEHIAVAQLISFTAGPIFLEE